MVDLPTAASPTILPRPPSGWFDYGYTALMDGRLALIRTRMDVIKEALNWREALATAQRGGKPWPPQPNFWGGGIRLSAYDGSVESEEAIVPTGSQPFVDRTADGEWLVVPSLPKEGDDEGRFYLPDGTHLRSASFGSGIAKLFSAPDGAIWIGYFDEGVFKGRNADGSWPISTGGIVKLDAQGKVVWSFNRDIAEAGSDRRTRIHVDDCYAMTLSGKTAWACYYAFFPVARMDGKSARLWTNGIPGANALAVANDTILFTAFGREDENRVAVAKIEGGNTREIGGLRFDPLVQAGARLIQGRDGILHVVADGVWYRLAVGDAAQLADPSDIGQYASKTPHAVCVVQK